MRFDLTDLSLFRHVVEAGSITHGAERAHLALAAASTRIRHMEEALGAALLTRGRGGRDADAGRAHAAAARAHDPGQAERLREDLGAYAGGLAGQVRVLSNTNALTEFLPETLSSFLAAHPQRQRRSRGAAVGRDRRADRRGRRRHRDRGWHGRSRRAGDIPLSQRPLRAGGGAAIIRWRAARGSASPRRWNTISSGSIARARCSASSPTRRAASGRPLGCACSCARSMGCAGWSSAMSASASCRKRPCDGPRGRWRSSAVQLTDPWALRDLSICVRDYKALPPYARQLVDHMREAGVREVFAPRSGSSNPTSASSTQ